MELNGLHILLTYQCTFECDHCFVFGSPWQSGTLTLPAIRQILQQAADLGTIEWIYFEGGEPFLYYGLLRRAIAETHARGFKVGVVSNAYWATDPEAALECLRPFQGEVEYLSLSSDRYHASEKLSQPVQIAQQAAHELDIPVDIIYVAYPPGEAELPGEAPLMYRGRASQELARHAPLAPWQTFDHCPYESLGDPGRVHIDPLGNIHVCQGISIGNLFTTPLGDIWANFHPQQQAVIATLLHGGPAELARRFALPSQPEYADACHLCFETRRQLRPRFPEILLPDQMYGVP